MNINKKLIAAIEFNPTRKSHQMSISDMCAKIEENKITLPLYQRDLSWTISKGIALLNYQLFGKAPVAPISINQISNKEQVPQVSFIDRELIEEENILADHQSVVDGQQRLTTNFKAYINHSDYRNVVLDVNAAKFKLIQINPSKSQIPVGILLNKSSKVLKNYLEERDLISELYPILIDVRSKIFSYNYTINIADNLKEEEQIKWFEVLNNAGSRVTALQMSFSKLKLHDFDIYKDYVNPFKEKIQEYGLDELFSPFTTNVSYPVASLNPAFEVIIKNGQHNMNFAPIPSDTKDAQITSLSIEDLKKITNLSLSSLTTALKFIDSHDLEDYISRMDYLLYITGYFTFKSQKEVTEDEIKILVSWVKTVDFSNKSNGQRRSIFSKLIS